MKFDFFVLFCFVNDSIVCLMIKGQYSLINDKMVIVKNGDVFFCVCECVSSSKCIIAHATGINHVLKINEMFWLCFLSK